MRAWCLALAALAGCDDPAPALHVDRALPDHAPLAGGTTIRLVGGGFATNHRVLIDGREAPLVYRLDDSTLGDTLAVVVPAGEHPGDVEVLVLGDGVTTSVRGILRYSAPPTVTGVSPRDVVFDSTDTRVTVTGTGFLNDAAGDTDIILGGALAPDVEIESDTRLTFRAPAGTIFSWPDLEVRNDRGASVFARGVRYSPGPRPGLLLFPRVANAFAVFYDPVDHRTVTIPWFGGTMTRFTSVARAADGELYGVDVGNRLGRIDLETQALVSPVRTTWRVPAMVRTGDTILAISRVSGGRFGTLDLATAAFTQLQTPSLFCCGSFGIATDGTTIWFTARQDWQNVYINTIDPVSGEFGTPVLLAGGPGFRVEELRWFAGALYATTPFGRLVTIDPATGTVTDVLVNIDRFNAMEVYE